MARKRFDKPDKHAPQLRQIVAPEGVPLRFEIGTAGDRLTAFAVDFFVILLATIVIGLLAFWAVAPGMGEYALAIALLASFFIRNFYFIYFELRWSGTTFGKRRLGLRVISRDGGPLTADMIFARNLTRDLEVFLPLAALMSPGALIPGAEGWGAVVAIAWLFVFALMPLFGKDRLRCGDLIAGTLVVREPRTALSRDLAAEKTSIFRRRAAKEPVAEDEFAFTTEQLDLYGIHELQVLEDLLRKQEKKRVDEGVLEAVCVKIRRKLGWTQPLADRDLVRFLRAFYKAQRARLEHKMLLGERKEAKTSRRLRPR